MNKIKANEKDMNDEIIWNYFKYQNPSFLAKDLIRANQVKNQQLVYNIHNGLINLRNAIIGKEIPENENPNKIVNIVEKILILNPNKNVKDFLWTKLVQLRSLTKRNSKY